MKETKVYCDICGGLIEPDGDIYAVLVTSFKGERVIDLGDVCTKCRLEICRSIKKVVTEMTSSWV